MDPQRRRTLDGRDLIKVIKRKRNGGKQGGRAQIGVIAESTAGTSGGLLRIRGREEKAVNMALIKLASLCFLLTLAFQNTYTLGEAFLSSENNKDGELKSAEKRTNNFRVPMDISFDPNFWPARGRRSRREPDREAQNKVCSNSPLDKPGPQCQQTPGTYEENIISRRSPPDFGMIPSLELDDEAPLMEKPESNCYEGVPPPKPRTAGRLVPKIPEGSRVNMLLKGFDEMRHKKQRHSGLPQLILYGNGVYWEPESLYGEKKKKQDVFWVARGKKNYNFLQK